MIQASSLLTTTVAASMPIPWESIMRQSFFAGLAVTAASMIVVHLAMPRPIKPVHVLVMWVLASMSVGIAGFMTATAAQLVSHYTGKSMLEATFIVIGTFLGAAFLFGLASVFITELRRDLAKSRAMIYD